MVQIFLGETPIKFSQERGTYEKEVVVENEVGGFSRYQVDEEGVVKTIESRIWRKNCIFGSHLRKGGLTNARLYPASYRQSDEVSW